MVVDEVIVHRNDNVDITLAIPIESEPTTEDSVSVQTLANLNNFRNFTLRFVLTLESFRSGTPPELQQAPTGTSGANDPAFPSDVEAVGPCH